LLSGHGIQGKSSGHLRNSSGAFGHHYKINNHQNGKDHKADSVISTDDKFAEGLDHMASRIGAGMPLQQHNPGGGHIQRQSQQGRYQKYCREGSEFKRFSSIDAGQQNDQ